MPHKGIRTMTRHPYPQAKYLLLLQPQVILMLGLYKDMLATHKIRICSPWHFPQLKETTSRTTLLTSTQSYQQLNILLHISHSTSRTPRTPPNYAQSLEQLGNRSSSEEEQASHKTQVIINFQKTKLLNNSRLILCVCEAEERC